MQRATTNTNNVQAVTLGSLACSYFVEEFNVSQKLYCTCVIARLNRLCAWLLQFVGNQVLLVR